MASVEGACCGADAAKRLPDRRTAGQSSSVAAWAIPLSVDLRIIGTAKKVVHRTAQIICYQDKIAR